MLLIDFLIKNIYKIKNTNNKMSSGFITESEIEEAKKLRQEEWDAVRKPEDPLMVDCFTKCYFLLN